MFRQVPLLGVFTLLLATAAQADDEIPPIDVCRDFSFVARDVMTARQKDRPMSETIPNATNLIKRWADKYRLAVDMEEAEEQAADLVMDAYLKASYDVEELQRDQISEFEDSYFKACYRELTSDSEE